MPLRRHFNISSVVITTRAVIEVRAYFELFVSLYMMTCFSFDSNVNKELFLLFIYDMKLLCSTDTNLMISPSDNLMHKD